MTCCLCCMPQDPGDWQADEDKNPFANITRRWSASTTSSNRTSATLVLQNPNHEAGHERSALSARRRTEKLDNATAKAQRP